MASLSKGNTNARRHTDTSKTHTLQLATSTDSKSRNDPSQSMRDCDVFGMSEKFKSMNGGEEEWILRKAEGRVSTNQVAIFGSSTVALTSSIFQPVREL